MKATNNPFAESGGDAEDQELVQDARDGSREALERLIARHQAWIYNIALRMLYQPDDAEDTTQEILIKVITKLSTFEARSSFRTWLYRIVVNHILNLKRRERENRITFEWYASELERTPDLDLPDTNAVPADVQLLVKEAEISCTSAMLLCLAREQRLIFILGDIFGVTDVVGGELLEISRDNFRQQLARARRDLQNFTQNKCGLVNPANSCRCARKTQGFVTLGYLDPQKLRFAKAHVTRVRDVAKSACEHLHTLDDAYADIHREHPFQEPPDFVVALRSLIDRQEFQSILQSPTD